MSDSHDTPPALPKPSSGGSYRWLAFLIAPVLGAMLGLVLAAVVTYIMPKRYESVAVLQVVVSSGIEQEVSALTSDRVLNRVVTRLDLVSRWMLPEDDALRVLRKSVRAEQVKDSVLVNVRARHASAQDSRDIAETVAAEFMEVRRQEGLLKAEQALNVLDSELREQEDLVEEKRKQLHIIVQAVGIPYFEDLRGSGTTGASEEAPFRLAQRQQYEIDREKQQLEIQIATLLRLESEELMKYAAGLNLPNNGVPLLYNDLTVERRELGTLQASGLGPEHPKVVMVGKRVENLEDEVEVAVENLRNILQTQLELIDSRLEEMNNLLHKKREDAVDQALEAQDYIEARAEYEETQSMLQAVKIAHSSRKIGIKIPENPVVLHEAAKEPRAPVSPVVSRNLMLGIVLGGMAGLVVAVPVAMVGRRKG